jgi:hypothetical protein
VPVHGASLGFQLITNFSRINTRSPYEWITKPLQI